MPSELQAQLPAQLAAQLADDIASSRINEVTLDARMQSRDALRFTPAGVPALDFQLVHESIQREAGSGRRVACELAAVALGAVAQELAGVQPGSQVRCKGFLARRYRTGVTMALHVNEFELLEAN